MHMRPRVQRASGIPCVLYMERAGGFQQSSGVSSREKVNACLTAVIQIGFPAYGIDAVNPPSTGIAWPLT